MAVSRRAPPHVSGGATVRIWRPSGSKKKSLATTAGLRPSLEGGRPAGQIWENWSVADWRLSASIGLGLRWSTPVGLVWADAAWPVANVGISSRDVKFYFGIGRPF